LAHPTRFERVTFAFGGQRLYAGGSAKAFRGEQSFGAARFVAGQCAELRPIL